MKEIEVYGVSTASDDTAPKGSSSNPYTYQEFDSMMNNGTWEGGYVEGYGYMDKGVTITGSSEDSDDSYSWEDPWSSLPSDPWASGSDDGSDYSGGQTGGDGQTDGNNNSGTKTSSGNIITEATTSHSDVLSKSQFSGYKDTDKRGCFNRCKEMLAAAGCELGSDEILMAKCDSKGRTTIAADTYQYGLDYIDGQLDKGHPVIVAVDYQNGHSTGNEKLDQAGYHFVIIVGGGRSAGYHYFDPATGNTERGTSSDNRFTREGNLWKDYTDCSGKGNNYTLSSIRTNK